MCVCSHQACVYLLDLATGVLYSNVTSTNQWPSPVGRATATGHIQLLNTTAADTITVLTQANTQGKQTLPAAAAAAAAGGTTNGASNPAVELFRALDGYLKLQQLRFHELFDAADADGSGVLESRELVALVKSLLPTAEHRQIAYFQVMP